MVDISERKAAEKKLKDAKDVAEAATLLKNKFVSLVAHDIRSPLSTVIGLQKYIVSKNKESQCNECRDWLGKSVGLCETMVVMTENLLESNNLHSGSIQINRKLCNVKSLCDTVMNDLRGHAEKKEIVLKNELPRGLRFYVDKVLFQRVIHNLVVNAIKFTANGGEIIAFQPEGRNVLAVKDTGVGISDGILPDLFKYEVKTSSTGTSGERGTGFGLPLSMDIAKAHGGTIRATSQKGEGSVFFVEMPDAKPLVLVADDDEPSALIIRTSLENMGAEVLEAKDGAGALKLVQERRPVLIIADYTMRLSDGFTLLDSLKSGAEFSKTPVVVTTQCGADDIETRKKAFEFGASDFLTKPLSDLDLIPRIGRFIAA